MPTHRIAPPPHAAPLPPATPRGGRARLRPGIYLVTPDCQDTGHLLQRLAPLLPHAALLQYRNKTADDALRHAQLSALLPACREAGVPLVVNDDWRLALALQADGAHLGGEDGDLRAAREACGPDFILGASCYGDLGLAAAATAAGASYLAFGTFHPSPTKPMAKRASPALLAQARALGLPVVAIGGITPDNAPALVAAGADLVAVISGVFDAPDPVAAMRAFAQSFPSPRSHRPGP